VVWEQSLYQDSDIFGQWLKTDGTRIGGNFRISDGPADDNYSFPVVAIDTCERAVVAWKDYRNFSDYYDFPDIYLQRLVPIECCVGPNIKISQEPSTAEHYEPAIAVSPEGNIFVVWHQNSTGDIGSGIIGQIVLADGTLKGNNFHIVNDPYRMNTTQPVVAANSTQIVYAWQDSRRSKGWDVYAKFDTWETHNVTNIPAGDSPVRSYRLEQNYPNPFNPLTHIRFYMLKTEYVEFDIFNMLGQRVKTFSRKKMTQGSHIISFDSSQCSSGIYFVKMKAVNFTDIKKMVLIK
jgi:hypothetical protein